LVTKDIGLDVFLDCWSEANASAYVADKTWYLGNAISDAMLFDGNIYQDPEKRLVE
jgi:hypothetical protein